VNEKDIKDVLLVIEQGDVLGIKGILFTSIP